MKTWPKVNGTLLCATVALVFSRRTLVIALAVVAGGVTVLGEVVVGEVVGEVAPTERPE